MILYKHKETGKAITIDSYNELSPKDKLWYSIINIAHYPENKPTVVHHHHYSDDTPQRPSRDISSTLISGAIGYATGSALLGGLLGGDMLGGIVGDLFEGDGLMD